MTTWQLRRAAPEDLDPIMAIEEDVFGTDAWSRENMAAELVDRFGYYLVAFPVGVPEQVDAYAGLRAPRGEPQADIQTIAIVPSARRQGLGRVLMGALIDEARRRGARELFLEVRADNPGAQALYDSLGFEAIAVRPRYYQPDGVDAIIMRLTIPEPKVAMA
ncbi:ribosomal-protein-alanine N-acetyltransferase [Microbacteriaceae bacterium SG_E_30_P1]|uniref:Ribosomal-protein-alanine N-acetyltransferase n=1 Tax=Antiquaquibacter oligotrophicus TaxID=2880260 RepID=A0ABT6KJT9_9MICO|nr:ribosomal protein S18-alanine N-acetyltransferase [Antiquaquibacter oligotrophicus]MDH6179950.1 ribosomal-protein-alanine N-acetyltransferase [Antiquaquibacter oligotrophicus]UDF14291.1 ribosomal protein S18-alanine N-acetyltransferase [Antiquaquibacter oligotrophicus]